MNDIQKIQIIHNLKEAFSCSPEFVQELLANIENSKYRDNIERFFRGYSIEDKFHYAMNALPWVRLVHKLDQTQYPECSKKEFQVPDYQVFYEDFNRDCFPSLLEVKSVKKEKHSLKIQKKQVDLCSDYSKTISSPLIYAIYWEILNTWTFNVIDQFESKSSILKINIQESIKNDLSAIYGNVNYIIPPLTRISVFDSSLSRTDKPSHEKYGVVVSDSLSTNNKTFIELSDIDGSVLDSCIPLVEHSQEFEGSKTTIIEKSENTNFFKLLNVILAHMALATGVLNKEKSRFSMFFVIEFFEKMNFKHTFSIPNKHTNMGFDLYQTSFNATSIMNDYKKFHKIK
ncbi:MAG: hypothetical protein K9N10_12915 [Deltaproteobacteria bacterium]|nr:hypothetical protein [Deltaproteobacteria bacterium]